MLVRLFCAAAYLRILTNLLAFGDTGTTASRGQRMTVLMKCTSAEGFARTVPTWMRYASSLVRVSRLFFSRLGYIGRDIWVDDGSDFFRRRTVSLLDLCHNSKLMSRVMYYSNGNM
jgi:hypothetical protein